MSQPLPPLNALRAFEATARHASFTRAAAELHVTPAALSHQIRGLEDFLGHKLFHRKARSIALTTAGELIYPGLHAAFAQVRRTVDYRITSLIFLRLEKHAYDLQISGLIE